MCLNSISGSPSGRHRVKTAQRACDVCSIILSCNIQRIRTLDNQTFYAQIHFQHGVQVKKAVRPAQGSVGGKQPVAQVEGRTHSHFLSGSSLTLYTIMQGVVFDVDGTLWFVSP